MSSNLPILIVDNDRRITDLLKIILEDVGYGVETVYSGEAAIERVKNKRYLTIIVDYSLGDMKGDDLANQLKLMVPGLRVILLTGFKSALEPSRLLGFKYVFEKPVNPKKLIEAIRQIMREGTQFS